MSKPSYNVPSMREIEQIDYNGLDVVSTFSGCGGSCLGYRLAGCRVLWASEFVEAAQTVYKANHPDSVLDTRDIRDVDADEILDAVDRDAGEIDILDGSPPCSDFSNAGKRDKGWGEIKEYSDTEQRVDDLFFEYARIVEGLQPKVFVAENVAGLVTGKAKGYFKMILRRLKRAGYTVKCRLLDAQWLGVPQRRKRLIFVGVRNDLDAMPAFPSPFDYRYSLRDAFETLPPHEPDENARIDGYAIGDEWHRLAVGEQSDKYFSLWRLHPDKPAATLTQTGGRTSAASAAHPTECRKFSIPEMKRLQGFPDDFKLSGSYRERYERLARAVPPVMMQQIAATIRDEILEAPCAGS